MSRSTLSSRFRRASNPVGGPPPDGMYEQRMVTTGIENKREVETTSGLRAGEKVVVSGAYFLKSEKTVRQGGGSMGGDENVAPDFLTK